LKGDFGQGRVGARNTGASRYVKNLFDRVRVCGAVSFGTARLCTALISQSPHRSNIEFANQQFAVLRVLEQPAFRSTDAM
jgi:hypothetical protein